MGKTLILGIGNPLLADDGIGHKIVHDLKSLLDEGPFDFETALVSGLELIDVIKGNEMLVMIDSVKTASGIPGEVNIHEINDFCGSHNVSNFHDIKFADILKMGKMCGLEIPEFVWIITVQIFDHLNFRNGLSPILQIEYPNILLTTKYMIQNKLENIYNNQP
jgi:hydrogenase maturation protease